MTNSGFMRKPAMLLFALLYAPGAALILLIGCTQLFFDGVASWRHARRQAHNALHAAPRRDSECPIRAGR